MARKRFLVSSLFMAACFCPSASFAPPGGGRLFRSSLWPGRPRANPRPERRSFAPEPRAGPPARSRDPRLSQVGAQRATLLCAGRRLIAALAAGRLQGERVARFPPSAGDALKLGAPLQTPEGLAFLRRPR